jgi:hypothetical protein
LFWTFQEATQNLTVKVLNFIKVVFADRQNTDSQILALALFYQTQASFQIVAGAFFLSSNLL